MFRVNSYPHIGAYSQISVIKAPVFRDFEISNRSRIPISERYWDPWPSDGGPWSSSDRERKLLFWQLTPDDPCRKDDGSPPCTGPTDSQELVDFLLNEAVKRRKADPTGKNIACKGSVQRLAKETAKLNAETRAETTAEAKKYGKYIKMVPYIGPVASEVYNAIIDAIKNLWASGTHDWTEEEVAAVSNEVESILSNSLPVCLGVSNGSYAALSYGADGVLPVLVNEKNKLLNLPEEDLDNIRTVFTMSMIHRNVPSAASLKEKEVKGTLTKQEKESAARNQIVSDVWNYLCTERSHASPVQVLQVAAAVAAQHKLPIRDFAIRLMDESLGWRGRPDLLVEYDVGTGGRAIGNAGAVQWAVLSRDALDLAERIIKEEEAAKLYEEQKKKEAEALAASQRVMSTEVTIPVASQASTGIASETKIMLGALAVIGIGYFFYRRSVL